MEKLSKKPFFQKIIEKGRQRELAEKEKKAQEKASKISSRLGELARKKAPTREEVAEQLRLQFELAKIQKGEGACRRLQKRLE